MKEINLEELKDLQLQMLKKIDEFCVKNNIKYFLSYGSLIGAIRHHGYIPWDDDIDIAMLRDDYNRFLSSFNGSVKDLEVNAPELNWNFYAPYANVYDTRTVLIEGDNGHHGLEMGVKIDVFPFDALPKSDFIYTITWKLIQFLQYGLKTKRVLTPFRKLTIKDKFLKVFFSCIPYSLIQISIHKLATSSRMTEDSDVMLRTMVVYGRKRAKMDIFKEDKYVPFEGYSFPVPVGADELLRLFYGDYMKLPPEEQRVAKHGFTAYWK